MNPEVPETKNKNDDNEEDIFSKALKLRIKHIMTLLADLLEKKKNSKTKTKKQYYQKKIDKIKNDWEKYLTRIDEMKNNF